MNTARRALRANIAAGLFVLSVLFCATARAEENWPDLASPARAVGGGGHDAAVVVGIEGYAFVPAVPGAEANAKAWYDYFTETRGVPLQNVKLLTGVDATREEMLAAARKAAAKAEPEGTLWFVFVGHGAPSSDGKDGLLVAVDAQQKSESLQSRALRREELLKALGESHAGAVRVVIDACFSGRGADGSSIAPGLQPLRTVSLAGPMDPRMVVLTAAKNNQFAGALPGGARPAFSYLVLGGLRGWAGKAKVTAGDLWRYSSNALEATLRGRNQTPELSGREDAVAAASAGEKGPDLAALAKATAGTGAQEEMFRVSNLPAVPRAQAPKALAAAGGEGLDFRNLDIEALKKYNEAIKLDRGESSPEDKATSWRELASAAPKFAAMAAKRAGEWDQYAAQEKAAEAAEQQRITARDEDWGKLSELLALDEAVVPEASKTRWAGEFLRAYWKSPGLEPAMGKGLFAYVTPGATQNALKALAGAASRPARVAAGKAGIEWVTIPGGSFMMGSDDGSSNEKPRHQVTVKTFQIAKSEVTNKQYQACVQAGACTAPVGILSDMQGDDQPVVDVDWNQASAFSSWVGGRLPSEAEWEYAARSAGKDWKYPWGDETATCETAVILGCANSTTAPVCSKAAGNTKQGLCDMAGNVWEWVQDWYHNSYSGAPTDGSAWEDTGSDRVNRGGSWYNDAGFARSAYRNRRDPGDRGFNLGFRPARRGH